MAPLEVWLLGSKSLEEGTKPEVCICTAWLLIDAATACQEWWESESTSSCGPCMSQAPGWRASHPLSAKLQLSLGTVFLGVCVPEGELLSSVSRGPVTAPGINYRTSSVDVCWPLWLKWSVLLLTVLISSALPLIWSGLCEFCDTISSQ